jgi:hypothetical protein
VPSHSTASVSFQEKPLRIRSFPATTTSRGWKTQDQIIVEWTETDESPGELTLFLDLEGAEELAQTLSAVVLAAKSGTFTDTWE